MSVHARTASAETSGARLSGWRLHVVRVAWLVLSVAVLGLAIIAFVAVSSRSRLEVLLAEGLFSLRPEIVDGLHGLGLSDATILAGDLALRVVALTAFAFTAAVIFLRTSRDWVAVLSSAMLLLVGTSWFAPLGSLADLRPHLSPYVAVVGVAGGDGVTFGRSLAGLTILLFLLVFPDGRFVPRWGGVVFAGVTAHVLLWTALPGTAVDVSTWPGLMGTAWVVGIPAFGLAAQAHRYVAVSGPLGRQQSKLVLTALGTIAVALPLLVWVRPQLGLGFSDLALVTPRIEALYQLILVLILALAVLLLPVSIALSALRYRLWDIDVLINRAVVYGALGAVVVGGWVLATVVLTLAFTPLLGTLRGSNAGVLLATVATAVVIRPVRLRVQDAVDRRFFRRKHEAERLLDGFAARLRMDGDLDTVADGLLDAVEGVLAPASVSLLLHEGDRRLAVANERVG